jgi:phospholipid/cholesterol/gamma-HCH transport system ATP-binding protein
VPDNIGLLYHKHLAMFGPREMLLSSEEPVVRQFLNAQRQGPIGMAEEKDADELAQEEKEGYGLPALPPIPLQLETSDGTKRPTQREPGAWCRDNNMTPPPGSFEDHNASAAAPAQEPDKPPTPNAPADETPVDGQPQDGQPQDGAAGNGKVHDERVAR